MASGAMEPDASPDCGVDSIFFRRPLLNSLSSLQFQTFNPVFAGFLLACLSHLRLCPRFRCFHWGRTNWEEPRVHCRLQELRICRPARPTQSVLPSAWDRLTP